VSRPVAVVTGAARGIGLESARRLSATHRVALLDLDGPAVERAAAEIGDAVAFECDITDARSVEAAVEGVVAACGGIDVCVSNAGIATAGALRHLDPDVVAAQLNVNLTGNWRVIHACLPHLVERRGYVLAVASVAAIVPPPGLGAYAASKAGLEQLLDVLRMEVRHLGVDVGVAYFSWIDTEMVRGAERQHAGFAAMRESLRGPAGKTLPVARAAEAIARAVERRSRRVVAPGFVAALYRLRGLIPELLEREAAKAGPETDRYTAELVAERGAFAAGLRPGELGSEAAARSMGRGEAGAHGGSAAASEPAPPGAAAPPATTARRP
jgi:NAD(P)-dependent dehydrogenase (short-subunit alcohol dehydrogenase family)